MRPIASVNPSPAKASAPCAGFYFGADYKLVLFAHADYLAADLTLTSATGRQLFEGQFLRHWCSGAARRELDVQQEPMGNETGKLGGTSRFKRRSQESVRIIDATPQSRPAAPAAAGATSLARVAVAPGTGWLSSQLGLAMHKLREMRHLLGERVPGELQDRQASLRLLSSVVSSISRFGRPSRKRKSRRSARLMRLVVVNEATCSSFRLGALCDPSTTLLLRRDLRGAGWCNGAIRGTGI